MNVVDKVALNPLFKEMTTKIDQLFANKERKSFVSVVTSEISSLSNQKLQPSQATETPVGTSIAKFLRKSNIKQEISIVSGGNGFTTLFDKVPSSDIPENKKENEHKRETDAADSSSTLQRKNSPLLEAVSSTTYDTAEADFEDFYSRWTRSKTKKNIRKQPHKN